MTGYSGNLGARRHSLLSLFCLVLLSWLAVWPASAQSSTPEPVHGLVPVEQDIAALRHYHRPAKEAGRRLADRGEEILPELHAALASPEANTKQRVQLITLLAEIAHPSSVEQVIGLARARPEDLAVVRHTLTMLPYLTPEPVGYDLASGLLRDPRSSAHMKSAALAYLALVRDGRGASWVDAYSGDENVYLRASALYLAAMLGDRSAKEPIGRIIDGPPPPALRHGLLMAYAEMATPEELTRRFSARVRESREYTSALTYSRLRTSVGAEREEAARELLQSPFVYDKKVAARTILNGEGPEALASLASQEAPQHVRQVVRHALRQGGYRVISDDNRLRLQERER